MLRTVESLRLYIRLICECRIWLEEGLSFGWNALYHYNLIRKVFPNQFGRFKLNALVARVPEAKWKSSPSLILTEIPTQVH